MQLKDYQLLGKRLRPLFIGAFLQSFVLWYAIEKPFLNSIGLNKEAITLVSIIFSSSFLIANIPLGIAADRWSRRGVLAIGSILLILGCIVADGSHTLFTYCIAAALFGTFDASTQGTYDSVVYDTVLEETDVDDSYTHYYGRLQFIKGIGFALSSLLGGIVSRYIDIRAAYTITIPAAAISIIFLLAFREPRLHKKTAALNLRIHLGQTFRTIMQKGMVAQIVGSLILATIGVLIMSQLDQLWMLGLALPILLYGPINALLLAGGGISGILSDRVNKLKNGQAIVIGAVVASSALLLVRSLPLVVVGQVIFLAGVTILGILLNRQLHAAATSQVRSGVSSVVTTASTIIYLPVALLFGYVSDKHTVFRAAWIVVALTLLLALSSILALYNQSRTKRV
jgi:MFS family permease